VVKLNGYAHLLAVAEGSPAETAGLEAGTYLRKMNHLSTRTMSVNQVRRTLAETKDQILFHVLEPGQAEDREITFQPSDFKMPVMNHQVLEDGIVHLRLPFLYGGFEQDLSRLLDSLDPRARILFDLRGNVLGDDGDLLKLAALFLEKGLLADWIDANGKRVQLLNPVTGPFENRELILLLDSGTHAAAEIFAAVAKQQKRAIVIGQPTHGFLGKYQALPLKNGGHILLPSHKLVLPSGETITGEGVSPDRELEVETVAEQSGDRLLEEALSQIRSGELKKAS
jgi:carboxyl-terminal processing protease